MSGMNGERKREDERYVVSREEVGVMFDDVEGFVGLSELRWNIVL